MSCARKLLHPFDQMLCAARAAEQELLLSLCSSWRDPITPCKNILPFCYGRYDIQNGATGRTRHSIGLPEPRARYRRPWLIAASNALVIVAEGEKKADRSKAFFQAMSAPRQPEGHSV